MRGTETGDESIVGEKWNLTPDHDSVDEEQVREILKRLPRARLPERALATLSWFYAAPLKPIIFHAENEFPHLSVRGKTESGKTSWLQLLSRALGMNGSPFAADATTFSLEMMHVGSRGAPVWIDEYKPSQMSPGRQDKLHTYLREPTREAVHTKGRPDQSFISYRMQSPICLSGEQTVTEPAVARRMMQVQVSQRATDMSVHTRAYGELAGEAIETGDGSTTIPDGYSLTDHALAYHRWLLSHDADELLELWDECRSETAELLDTVGATMQGTERQAVQVVTFGWRLFRQFAREFDVSESELPTHDTLVDAVEHVTGNVGKNGQRREHGDELLELASQAAAAGYLEPDDDSGDTPYRVYQPQAAEGDAVALHLPTVYPEVQRFVRDYNLESEYNLLSKSDYDNEFGDVAGDGSHVLATAKVVRNVAGGRKRSLVIDATRARRRLGEDFLAEAFGAEVDVDDETTEAGDDDGGGPPVRSVGDDSNGGRLAPVDVTPAASDAHGRVPSIEAEVTGAWKDRYGNPSVSLSDGDVTLTATVVGPGRPELHDGARVVVENAKLTTDELGNVALEIDPPTEVRVVETPTGDDSDRDDSEAETEAADTAAADGGTAAGDSERATATDSGETADDGERRAAVDGDPPRPEGPHDDVQCRQCGVHWLAGSKDGSPLRDCPQCDAKIDWEWNVNTGRVPESAAPDPEIVGTLGKVRDYLGREQPETVTVPALAGELGEKPPAVRDALNRLAGRGDVIAADSDGGEWEVID